MQPSQLAKRAWLLLFLTTALVYFYGLGWAPLVGADEPRYAQVAREMYERGGPVTPTLGGLKWFEKPALPYWAAMAGFRLFGVGEWGARAGATLAGLLTVLLVGWVAARAEAGAGAGERGWLGLACGAAASSCAGLVVFSRALNFDIFLTAAITAALACFFAAESEGDARKRAWLLACAYAGVGAALLAKGLVGLVLPCGVVAVYQLLRRRRPRWLLRSAAWGVPLMLLAAASWYAPVLWRHGREFVDEFVVRHHFARYVSNKYHHPQPFYFYLPITALLALPWTAFLASALWRARRWDWRGADALSRLRVFAFAWLVVPVAFFSFSGSKLPGYVLPALPGALLLAGERLAAFVRGEGEARAMRATGALMLAAAAACLLYAHLTRQIGYGCALLVAAPPALAGAHLSLSKLGAARERDAVLAAGASLLTVMLIVSCALRPVARRESVRELLEEAARRGYAHTPVWNLYSVERSTEFYAARRLAYDATGNPVMLDSVGRLIELLKGGGGPVLVVLPAEYVPYLTKAGVLEAEMIGDNGVSALFVVRSK